jgi:serine/threonine protein kinase
MAPEIYLNKGYTQKVDIWSLGVLLYEILAGNSPFLSPQEATLSALERQNVLKENILALNIRFPDTFPPLARDLVRKLLTLEPKDRLPLEEMLKHPWFMTSTDEID